MRLMNLTPHELAIRASSGTYKLAPGGTVARCEQTSDAVGEVIPDADMAAIKAAYSALEGPEFDALPAGERIRRVQERAGINVAGAIAVTRQSFGAVTGLPAPRPDTAYIVSRIVAEACRDRDDLLIPGPAIRDESGRVVGCDGLSRL